MLHYATMILYCGCNVKKKGSGEYQKQRLCPWSWKKRTEEGGYKLCRLCPWRTNMNKRNNEEYRAASEERDKEALTIMWWVVTRMYWLRASPIRHLEFRMYTFCYYFCRVATATPECQGSLADLIDARWQQAASTNWVTKETTDITLALRGDKQAPQCNIMFCLDSEDPHSILYVVL